MNKRDLWLVAVAGFLLISYLTYAFTGALGRAPLVTQQSLAICVGVFIGRAARLWLHN